MHMPQGDPCMWSWEKQVSWGRRPRHTSVVTFWPHEPLWSSQPSFCVRPYCTFEVWLACSLKPTGKRTTHTGNWPTLWVKVWKAPKKWWRLEGWLAGLLRGTCRPKNEINGRVDPLPSPLKTVLLTQQIIVSEWFGNNHLCGIKRTGFMFSCTEDQLWSLRWHFTAWGLGAQTCRERAWAPAVPCSCNMQSGILGVSLCPQYLPHPSPHEGCLLFLQRTHFSIFAWVLHFQNKMRKRRKSRNRPAPSEFRAHIPPISVPQQLKTDPLHWRTLAVWDESLMLEEGADSWWPHLW